MSEEIIPICEASQWASNYLGKPVTDSNISYLVQYAKVKKYSDDSKKVKVNLEELKNYYDENVIRKQEAWRSRLGKDLNWALSFDHLREADTTKHVHRLHPYKGKFIPQLVEYFLDDNTNNFKKEVFFEEGDIILDPFMGSGTTLIQASELGMHSIGIDVSEFNCLISEAKLSDYDMSKLSKILKDALIKTVNFSNRTFDDNYDIELKEKLSHFNRNNFPSPEFKRKVIAGKINEKEYSDEKIIVFLKQNQEFFEKNGTKDKFNLFDEKDMSPFLSKWFSKRIKQELFYYIKLIEEIDDENIQNMMKIIVSRTARSCRATTHSDLATLKEPQKGPYYCSKHRKICTPINTILGHLKRNTFDTMERIKEYSALKKNVFSSVLHSDSRNVNIFEEVKKQNPKFFNVLNKNKISGVFTSPPYVGQIDYHEQHAYAYELFDIERLDDNEIGPLYKGQGKKAIQDYINGISNVLVNISKYMKEDGHFFIVANDKYNLYPIIAEKSNLVIVNQFKRPVLNRTERDRQPYAEIIFHMRKKI